MKKIGESQKINCQILMMNYHKIYKNEIKREDAVRKFVFSRTLQLWHSDGLTFEFLFNIAKELDENNEMMLVGSGEKGRDP